MVPESTANRSITSPIRYSIRLFHSPADKSAQSHGESAKALQIHHRLKAVQVSRAPRHVAARPRIRRRHERGDAKRHDSLPSWLPFRAGRTVSAQRLLATGSMHPRRLHSLGVTLSVVFLLLVGSWTVASNKVDPFQYATRGEEAVSLWEFSLPEVPTGTADRSIARAAGGNPVSEQAAVGSLPSSIVQEAPARRTATRAYVTRILDWRREVPAACALAHSILNVVYGVRAASAVSANDVELVALVPDKWLPLGAKYRLESCGFRVHPVRTDRSVPRYLSVPLAAWSLTQYRAVIFLEPTSLALSPSIQELFHCGCFCAPVQTGEYFSTGVFGLRPSTRVHARMLQMILRDILGETPPGYGREPRKELLWHEAGQSLNAFLNTFLRDFLRAPYFPQMVPAERIDEDDAVYGELIRNCCNDPVLLVSSLRMASDPAAVCVRRLPIGYDGDPVFHGVFSNTRVIRFGQPFTPYAWWSRWVIGNKVAWQASQRALAGSRASLFSSDPVKFIALSFSDGTAGGLAFAGSLFWICWHVAYCPHLVFRAADHMKAQLGKKIGKLNLLLYPLWDGRLLRLALPSGWPFRKQSARFARRDPESSGFFDQVDDYSPTPLSTILCCGYSTIYGFLSGTLAPCIAWMATPSFLPAFVGMSIFVLLCLTLQLCFLSLVRLHFVRKRIRRISTLDGALRTAPNPGRPVRGTPGDMSAATTFDSRDFSMLRSNGRPTNGAHRSKLVPFASSKLLLVGHALWWVLAPQVPILITRNMRVVIAMWGGLFLIYCCLSSLSFHQAVLADWLQRFENSSRQRD